MKIKLKESKVYSGNSITVRELIKALEKCPSSAAVMVHGVEGDRDVKVVEDVSNPWSDGCVILRT